jgi:imidazole glycerol phosphate synthase glutamine amidotransferase subunit
MSSPAVAVVDWGGGNVGSVLRALRRAGAAPEVTADPDAVRRAERLVLPGVGAFGTVMDALRARALDLALRERLRGADRPFLGICVGLQALFEESEESPGARGLGLLPGAVRRFRAAKVPQTGWNEVLPARPADPLIARGHAYFVNSYAAPAPEGASWVAAVTDYEGPFASAVRAGGAAALAVQFHPEKSGAYGAALLARWLAC